jgi:hypothetical protein
MRTWQTLRDMYSSREYEMFISDKLGNDLSINDPERAERIHEAASFGTNGSTHAETIEDWREFLDLQKTYNPEWHEPEEKMACDLLPEQFEKITQEIDKCEKWHIDYDTINNQGL